MTALATATLPSKDLLSLDNLEAEHLELIFHVAAKLKAGRDQHTGLLEGKRLAMIFEKDSLRTRFTFDIGMTDMGGTAVFLDHRDARLGSRESVKDMARNLERWVDVIVARTYKQRAIEELAANCEIPVINGLSDHSHPCQALTDYFTLTEKFGDLKGKTLCYVGDGNNTCHSLMVAGTKLGVNVVVCTPEGYEPEADVIAQCKAWAEQSGGSLKITSSVDDGVKNANVIYTDVWASMGQEDEIEERAAVFNDYQVDEEMMAQAAPGAYFLHCLPAHRGAEVSAGVMDGPQSIVYDNAENRLHVQKAIMVLLLNAWN
jgi:ornithine carbamoyltransferase